MSELSIRQLEEYTLIRSHTIRIWEKRFALFNPKRTRGNIRHYTVEDFKRLMNIAFLNKAGWKISKILTLGDAEMDEVLATFTGQEERIELHTNALIAAMFALDVEGFEATLDECIAEHGIADTINKVIIPFLEKTGIVFYKDRSNETHFVVTALRKKIILGIEHCTTPPPDSKTALLFLPEGEHYDLLLLYVFFLLKCNGIKVIYLGTNLPFQNIANILERKKPDYLYIHVHPKKKYDPSRLIEYLEGHLPHARLFVVSSESPSNTQKGKNITYIHFKNAFSALAEVPA